MVDKQEARRALRMCAYCGEKVEKGHWVYRGNLFCSGPCLLEFVGTYSNDYEEYERIVSTVQTRMRYEMACRQEKVVPRAEEGEFSEANRFRGLDY